MLTLMTVGGLLMLAIGVIYSNSVVYRMAKYLNAHTSTDPIPALLSTGPGAMTFRPISRYRQMSQGGPLCGLLTFGYWICGCGFGLILVGTLVGYWMPNN